MADVFRWRYDATEPVVLPFDSAQVVEVGDAVFLSTDDVRAADQSTYAGGLATSQEAFVDNFVGVSAQRSRALDTDDLTINTAGVYEFIMASATAEVGDLFGMDDNSGPTALENQTVIAVTDAARAIGRCAKRVGSAATSVLVRIISTNQRGGAQSEEASA